MTYYPLLGVRTDFSLGESIIGVDHLNDIAERIDTNVVGIADTMNVSAMVEASKSLSKKGRRLLMGVRIRVVMEATKEDEAAYFKLWPVNDEGMRSIYRLLTRSFLEDRFYYVPRVTWGDVEKLISDDCLAITTGDAESVIQREDMCEALAALLSRKRFCKSFYELVPSDTPYWSRHNKLAHEFGQAHGLEPIVLSPSLWDGDASHAFSINASIIEKRPYEDYLRPVPQYRPYNLQEMVREANKARLATHARYLIQLPIGQGVKNTAELVDACQYKWGKLDPSLPTIALDPDKALRDMCILGMKQRFASPVLGHKPETQDIAQKYAPRLQFELDTLKRLGFAQYFLLVQDLVAWSKSQGIYVGPGRGSVGGSLVAYLIGITDVDPVRFDLLFERFINPDRLDLPDADLDFMSTRRHEVIAYLEKRWGKANVAGIVNYNTLGAKSAIRDIGRIVNLPGDALRVNSFIGDNHGISETLEEAHALTFEVQEFAKQYPVAWKHALALEGRMRSFGTHAAGVVVSGEPLINRAVVERRGSGGDRAAVINWDKRVSEEQGLIKLDVLGLSTLDMFDQTIKLIWKRHTKRIDINSISLDDPKTLDIFNEARTHGVFQFESGSVRRLLKEMAKDKPIDFEDLVALNALNRPGPLDAGLAESYIKRRAGVEAVTYPHPSLEPILKDTFGVMAYQEQIMQITRTLSGFTPGEADGVRKAIGKKDLAKMAEYKDQFVDGAVKLSGMDQGAAEKLWADIEGFAAYSFNRSHAVEYSLIGYQAAYLKAHYPVEFYCGQMGTTGDDKLAVLAKKAAEDGIRVIPPDINLSTDQYEPLNDNIILSPLNCVKNVSEKSVRAIMEARNATKPTIIETTTGRGKNKVTTQEVWGPGPFKSIEDFQKRVPARAANQRAVDHLNRVGAFCRIEPGQVPSIHPSRQKDQIELMPTLADQGVLADRDIDVKDEFILKTIAEVEDLAVEKLGEHIVLPHYGANPKMMIVLDAPFNDYEELSSQWSFNEYVRPALHAAGLTIDDAVWTWVLKRPLNKEKKEKTPPEAEVALSLPILQAEVAVTKPPVIVLLGTTAIKQFFPDLKKPNEHIGAKHFNSKLDATVIIGFKPTQIYFDASKEQLLTEIFSEAKRLT